MAVLNPYNNDSGLLETNKQPITNKNYESVVVHKFKIDDGYDPQIYAAQIIWDWQQTTVGKWVMENSVTPPRWYRNLNNLSFEHQYAIVAYFEGPKATEWALKYRNTNDFE